MTSMSGQIRTGALQGRWGGSQLQLSLHAGGGQVEMDCASGTVSGPVQLGSDGRFTATGTFSQHQAGPQPGDAAPASAKAQYSGEVHGGVMTLRILPEGANQAQLFTLREGAAVKLRRCL